LEENLLTATDKIYSQVTDWITTKFNEIQSAQKVYETKLKTEMKEMKEDMFFSEINSKERTPWRQDKRGKGIGTTQ
jgi:leucyl aminopeptidase (aminopeptidase T)